MESSHANLEYGFCPLRPEKKRRKIVNNNLFVYYVMKMIGTPDYQIKSAHVNAH